MQELHLIRVFREHARTWQDRPAQRAQAGGPGSPWLEVTWGELGRIMDLAAQGLIALGHQEGDMVGLCARNMPEWTQADLAILAARGVTVPLYPTSTLEQAKFIIRDAGIHILVVGEQAQVDLALALLAQGEISHVVALDGRVDLRGCPQALTLQALMALGGEPAPAQELVRRSAAFSLDDLLTLVYTSGTTGEPKGVMLDHANLTAAMRLHDGRLKVGEGDVSLCMLPLSHIFERAWTFYVLYRGAVNVYLRDPQTVIQVIGEVKPTHMCAVPRVYEKAYAGIQGRMDKAPRLLKGLFHWAMGVGSEAVQLRVQGRTPGPWLALKHRVADRLVFRKLRGLFGGRCRFFPVAGASLADDVNLFFQAIGLNLKYGYGLSETCATVSCYEDTGLPIGTLGRPLEGLEVKLGDEHEILVKGPTIMRGYYNRPEETAKVMTADGFLRTGDAGNLDAEGNLIFTERIKELMKTSNGQYVAPQKVEGTLGKDAFIDQIAIIADSRNFVSALIVPSFEGLEEHARAMGLKYRNMTELLAHSKVVEFFESRIHRLQAELAKHEQVKKFTLLPRAFSMEMGELTPTLKLRRKCIEAAFRAEIEAMYKKMTS
jgi:long-chain acyl-CoA synthetase